MQRFFREMFEYSHHFNLLLADQLQDPQNRAPGRATKIFSHMINAHQVWNTRITRTGKTFGIWQEHLPPDYKRLSLINFETSLQILEEKDLEEIIDYSNSRGDLFSNKLRDMLFQVINHSTYHRGQLAMLFRDNGVEPLLSEYIIFKR